MSPWPFWWKLWCALDSALTQWAARRKISREIEGPFGQTVVLFSGYIRQIRFVIESKSGVQIYHPCFKMTLVHRRFLALQFFEKSDWKHSKTTPTLTTLCFLFPISILVLADNAFHEPKGGCRTHSFICALESDVLRFCGAIFNQQHWDQLHRRWLPYKGCQYYDKKRITC